MSLLIRHNDCGHFGYLLSVYDIH